MWEVVVSSRTGKLPLSDRMLEVVAARFRALGEPHRLRILQVLEAGEAAVGEIAQRLKANQSNVSRHLQSLYDAGLVGRRREGSNIFYSISDPTVLKICHLVCARAEENARNELAEMTTTRSREG
jgi:DNA-binding transcriptional ArsR family regulator